MKYRPLFLASIAVAALSLLLVWWTLPQGRIPMHFGSDGEPDGWGNRSHLLGALGGVVLVLALFLGWLGARIPRMGWEFINVPRKEFWSRPENAARAKVRVQEDAYLTGAWTMWLMALVPVMVKRSVDEAVETGRSSAVDLVVVLGAAALLVVGVVWRQRWYRRHAEE